MQYQRQTVKDRDEMPAAVHVDAKGRFICETGRDEHEAFAHADHSFKPQQANCRHDPPVAFRVDLSTGF
jgi:hypothetical protein